MNKVQTEETKQKFLHKKSSVSTYRDGFGVLGLRGVNGFAAGLSTNFLAALPGADLSDGVDSIELLLLLVLLLTLFAMLLLLLVLLLLLFTEGCCCCCGGGCACI